MNSRGLKEHPLRVPLDMQKKGDISPLVITAALALYVISLPTEKNRDQTHNVKEQKRASPILPYQKPSRRLKRCQLWEHL